MMMMMMMMMMFEQSLHKCPIPFTLVSSIIISARSEVVLIAHVPRSSRNALGMVAPFVSDVFLRGYTPLIQLILPIVALFPSV